MTEQDRTAFAELITGIYQVYGRSIGGEGLVFWWNQLQTYDLESVQEAFRRHLSDSEQSRRLPTPFDVLSMLRRAQTISDKPRRDDSDFKRASPESLAAFVENALHKLGVKKSRSEASQDKPPEKEPKSFRVSKERREEILQKAKQLGIPSEALGENNNDNETL